MLRSREDDARPVPTPAAEAAPAHGLTGTDEAGSGGDD